MKTKRTTAQHVADLAGVSRTTVSFVLNNVPGVSISDETRRRVLEAARKLDYYPDAAARRLVSGKARTIGLVLRQSYDQIYADAFLLRVMLGLSHAAEKEGYQILLSPMVPTDDTGYTRLVHEKHVDGFVLSGPRQDDEKLVQMHAEGTPIMLLGQLPGTDIPCVDIDTVEGAAKAVGHLTDCGRNRIAMITNASLEYTSAQQRLAGYRRALESAGLPYDDGLVRQGAFTPASGREAMSELLALHPRPDAVFVASDVVALGAIQAIKAASLAIPRDIALAGFDDIPFAQYYDPPLSTVRLPAYDLGYSAAERLLAMIQGKEVGETMVLLETRLVIRTSTIGSN